MRGEDIPPIAEKNTLRTYDELHKKFDDFLQGRMTSTMLLIARPGIGKSFYTKKYADREITLILEGNLRPLKTYIRLYQNRNKLVVLDDAETLWADKSGRIVLRELTDTSIPKTLSWTSTVKALSQENVPTSFKTNSRTLIICNTFKFGRSDETDAVLDRCQCYCFDPTNEQVARYAADWFWNQEVFDYACTNLHRIKKLSARMFVRADERLRLNDPRWREEFPLLGGVEAIVQDLCTDPAWQHQKRAEQLVEFQRRVVAYKGLTDAELPSSRATFYRTIDYLVESGQMTRTPPEIRLAVSGAEPAVPMGVEAILADVQKAQEECETVVPTGAAFRET